MNSKLKKITNWSWRTLLWVVLTPILLFLLLAALIYLPPVQKWAVDKASEVLSEEMGMDVGVETVRLKFPLDLSMGGMSAVQDGDTLIYATALDVSVRLMPLLEGKVEVDGIQLLDTRLNTKGMIDACAISGHVGEISLDSHSTDLKSEFAVVNKALISDADLFISLNDSVPEDTTTSEPVNWKAQIDDVQLKNVKATILLTPNADSTYVSATIGSAKAKAFLDLGEEIYRVEKLDVEESSASYEVRTQPRLPKQLDANHLLFNDLSVSLDSLCYQGNGELALNLRSLIASEQSGLKIKETCGKIEMDSVSLSIPKMSLKTDDSSLAFSYRMDLNAFADSLPGSFRAVAEGQLGKGDLVFFTRMGGESTKDVCDMMAKTLPAQPTQLSLKADGNLEALSINDLYVKVPGLVTLEGDAKLWDIIDDLSLETTAKAQFGKSSSLNLKASYVMAEEAYKAEADFKNIILNQFADLSDNAVVSGSVSANGRGFDFLSQNTRCSAQIHLDESRYGSINLSTIDADGQLEGNKMALCLSCDNNQLKTNFNLDGELKKNLVSGVLDIDLPFLDAQSMGFSNERLQCSTSGTFDFMYNLEHEFRVESNVDALQLKLGKDSLVTSKFYLLADARSDSTALCLQTGDLDFDFYTPNNILKLQPRLEKLIRVAEKQAKDKEIDINVLKTYLPELHLHAVAGKSNPVSQILSTYGFKFREFVANVEASPSDGVSGKGHVYAFETDSITIDTAFFAIVQDSTKLRFTSGVACRDQATLPAFRANIEGHFGTKDADVHLTYYNKKNEKGIDLGLLATGTDSCHHVTLYPSQPIIGFHKYAMNADNYICLQRDGKPVIADVRLQSLSDSSTIALIADQTDSGEQIATAKIRNFDVARLLSILPIPNLPKMEGLLSLNANYLADEDKFKVDGDADIQSFRYEGMDVGSIGSNFVYTPQGATAHGIDASLSYNGTKVAMLNGVYNGEGEGFLSANASLTDIPMSLLSPFMPDQMVSFTGCLAGNINIYGPTSSLLFNGALLPKDVHVKSPSYSVDLTLSNDSISIKNSRVLFNQFKIYGYDQNPLAVNGYFDFADFDNMNMSLTLYGSNVKLVDARRTAKKVLFGNMYGDFMTRINGSLNDLSVRGLVRVLKTTDMTYIMSETPLSQGARLDDIVTFVDFNAMADDSEEEEKRTFMGLDMNLNLVIEDGANLRAELSADRQSFVDVQGGGSIRMTLTPEGVLNMQGRYTINEGEMKYALPVIPLRTFTIHNGSYVEFSGSPMNPTLNITATERTRATVGSESGASRSVTFDAGLKISNTLSNMGLEFIIEAPEDMAVQNELDAMSAEERNKLAVAMLATSMYLASSNAKGFTASNALNSFLQNEINNIAGKALNTLVNVDVGMEQTTRDNGTIRTDYSFKFSRRFFSDRLNVIIGGKVSADGDTESKESGTYIDDISVEWRLDDGGTQYIRLFHEKEYTNLIEGELDKNGGGVVLRKKVDKFSDLYFWRRKKEE